MQNIKIPHENNETITPTADIININKSILFSLSLLSLPFKSKMFSDVLKSISTLYDGTFDGCNVLIIGLSVSWIIGISVVSIPSSSLSVWFGIKISSFESKAT